MPSTRAQYSEIASLVLAVLALYLTLRLNLLPALLSGLLVYQLVHMIAPRLTGRWLHGSRARLVVVALIATLTVVVIGLGMWGIIVFLRGEGGNLPALMQKMADVLATAKSSLPAFMQAWVSDSTVAEYQVHAVEWLKEHASEIRTVGGETVHTVVNVLFGLVIGAMVALHEAVDTDRNGPLAVQMRERLTRFSDSFRRVVFAQIKIAGINAVFTGIYLLAILPLAGVHLPLAKTMVVLTFLFGLIPVVGNLASNAVIVVTSMSHSPTVAVVSLFFLVVIHKLEYFLNAKIVGYEIKASAWELLLAMLVMKAAFGLPGIIFAPILYAYIKRELSERELI